jgi:hypothetical protein
VAGDSPATFRIVDGGDRATRLADRIKERKRLRGRAYGRRGLEKLLALLEGGSEYGTTRRVARGKPRWTSAYRPDPSPRVVAPHPTMVHPSADDMVAVPRKRAPGQARICEVPTPLTLKLGGWDFARPEAELFSTAKPLPTWRLANQSRRFLAAVIHELSNALAVPDAPQIDELAASGSAMNV